LCWHLISPHTLWRSGSHLKHVFLLVGSVRFGNSRRKDTGTGFKRQETCSLDIWILKKENGIRNRQKGEL